MSISLPSRYESLDEAYRGRLIPNAELLNLVNRANKSIQISGGIRFLPLYGESGAGKTSAAREISTHIPSAYTFVLGREDIEIKESLLTRIKRERDHTVGKLLIAIIDQYEENVVGKEKIPTQFVEYLSLFDRGELSQTPIIFIWLTTSLDFQKMLVKATSRNRRILLHDSFVITGPNKLEWPKIIDETFSFHNSDKSLADFEIIDEDVKRISIDHHTIGSAMEEVGVSLADNLIDIHNLSEYQVILMWPVSDALRTQRVLQFSKAREGYKLNWEAWHRELNAEDRAQLPLKELNRTRLYFDVRIIPIRAADLHRLCNDLENPEGTYGDSYVGRFTRTHFYQVIADKWDEYEYTPLKERESKRAEEARIWYESVTTKPTQLGRRIARVFRSSGLEATYEYTLTSGYSSVRADIFIKRPGSQKPKVIIEIKAFSAEATMPSSIKDAIKVTLRRHAQFAGFLQRQ
ncbi:MULTISPECIES: ATP-binding protein [Paenibacillus]|uniref:ATP-binding protein n=1 Tax=Paenibacillus TaxID=44249 RepID=UPI0022B86B85|nr:ATP-binding protein [Paenibacillus caseinilyticus]MCZ8524055.1 ATP-binding protein [Paenibacillus caseinilyticus]